MPVADDDQDAPRLIGLALHQRARGAGLVDGVVKRRAAARFELAHLLDDRLGVAGCVHQKLGFVAVRDQIAAVFFVAGEHVERHLDRSVLKILPVDAGGVAHIEEETDHHGLVPLAREELDLLVPALVLNAEIGGVQVGYETSPIVGHGDGHDDLVDLHSDGRTRRLRRDRTLRVLCQRE